MRTASIFQTAVSAFVLLATPIAGPTAGWAESGVSAASDFEQWQAASDLNTMEALEAFVFTHPDSAFVPAAEAQLAALKAAAETRAVEDAIFAVSGNVTFSTPLSLGSDAIIGKTLPEVLKSSPEFPPVAGLPEEYWKEQTCSACHQWTRETICTQAQNYISMDALKYTSKDHPFGGVLKVNLRNWAQHGCQ